jgi:hypothetical protein
MNRLLFAEPKASVQQSWGGNSSRLLPDLSEVMRFGQIETAGEEPQRREFQCLNRAKRNGGKRLRRAKEMTLQKVWRHLNYIERPEKA